MNTDSKIEPEELLILLNADPAFVDANTLNTGKAQFDLDDAAMFLWQSEVMENSHLIPARDPHGLLVLALTVLIPHPREEQPWIGALFVHPELGFNEVAAPALRSLEERLSLEGWQAIYVSPMRSETKRIADWQANGYSFIEARLDNNEREVLVHRKPLG